MMWHVQRWRTLGFGLLLTVLAGCGQGAQYEELNDWFAKSNQRIGRVAWNFRTSVLPLSKNEPIDIVAVKSAHKDLENIVRQIKEEWKTLKVPDLALAKEMHKQYATFLDGQAQLVDQEFASVVRWAETPRMTTSDQWKNIMGEFGEIGRKESGDIQKLLELQIKLGNEVGMRLYTPEPSSSK